MGFVVLHIDKASGNDAGLTRKIGTNQVRALRIMLSGTPEDMQCIEAGGKLDQWCKDNIDWLRQKYQELKQVIRAHIKPPTKSEANKGKGIKR